MSPAELAILTVGLLLGYVAGRRFSPTEAVGASPASREPKAPPATTAKEPLPSLAEPESDDALQSASRSLVSYIDQLDSATGDGGALDLQTAGASDGGKNHPYLVLDNPGWTLTAVADGLSSHADGNRARELVIETLERRFRDTPGEASASKGRPAGADRLVSAIEAANRIVFEEAALDSKLAGMAATVVASLFLRGEGRLCIAHVGDSRAYRLREGRWQSLTAVHTLAAKGVSGPFSSKLYRAVGMKARVRVDIVVASVEANDMYLLCTDAVVKAFGEDRLVAEMCSGAAPATLAARLIEKATQHDLANASAVVGRVVVVPPASGGLARAGGSV